MNLDAFYAAFSSVAQAINNIGQSLTTLADIATGTPTVATTTTVSSMPVLHIDPYPTGSEPYAAGSGDVGNSIATATIASTGSIVAWLYGFDVYSSGATGASVVLVTVTGLRASATLTFPLAVSVGAAVQNAPLSLRFNPPLMAQSAGTPIVVTVPALGAGNLHCAANVYGYRT